MTEMGIVYTGRLVVVCRGEGFGVWQFASELAWLMDQDW